MDQATLDGCFEKVRRAEELRGELERIVETFANTNPYPAWVEGDRNTGQYSIFIDYSPPPPIKMAVVFGEHLHDLRSALDHLAWREAIEFIGRNPTKREERAIYFPLRKSRADFRSAEVLRYVSKDARAILERHQPYKRGQGERPKALALLAWFSNEDKHRTLPMTPNLGPIGELRVRHRSYAKLLSMSEVFRWSQRVRGKTEVARLQFVPGGPEPHVRMEREPAVHIGVGRPPRGLRGLDFSKTPVYVREVIADFAQLLP